MTTSPTKLVDGIWRRDNIAEEKSDESCLKFHFILTLNKVSLVCKVCLTLDKKMNGT